MDASKKCPPGGGIWEIRLEWLVGEIEERNAECAGLLLEARNLLVAQPCQSVARMDDERVVVHGLRGALAEENLKAGQLRVDLLQLRLFLLGHVDALESELLEGVLDEVMRLLISLAQVDRLEALEHATVEPERIRVYSERRTECGLDLLEFGTAH